ncbi:MAG: hypothetical protein HY721_28845 [Planctomycetes bacterium]|nr:hypothetical protein [Planctomycetota bacterium]
MTRNRPLRTVVSIALLLPASGLSAPALAGEVGFIEDFALAEDRAKALEQLIPGTEEHYFFHCLHYQSTGQLERAERLLGPWIERHGRTPRVVEVENRQALLRYPSDPKGSLAFLANRLGLTFQHEREALGEAPRLPVSLDPGLIGREAFLRRALDGHPGSVDGLEDSALEVAAGLDLGPERRRGLLARLRYPDVPDLPRLVVEDLKTKGSGGFGSLPIHRQLLLAQLDECLRLRPELLNVNAFVQVYLTKLRPSPDGDWRTDPKEREAYLDRLWNFVSRLNPSHNSLKAHVLYRRLAHDRALGTEDKGRFLAYLKLPRNAPYVRREHLERAENRPHVADLGASYSGVSLFPPVGGDEPLVRGYLERFLRAEEGYEEYAPYLDDAYLRAVFAETKVLGGIGDQERWYSMLGPARLQALKDRVELDFAPTSKTWFGHDEQVGLDVQLKNVKTLIVKVFELNALNFYRDRLAEIDASVDLDGLVPSEETTHESSDPPLRRTTRRLELPSLSKRGAFVVELIGGGKSSRAVIRKGKLRLLERFSVAGHVFTVLDEANRKLPDARLWIGGREYLPEKDGTFTVPFSGKPGRTPAIAVHGDFASLDAFQHKAEEYALAAGIHLEREALLSRARASVVVRPVLLVNGERAPLGALEEPSLLIASTDREGVRTTSEVKPFELHEDRESAHELQVPARLASLEVTLRGRVQVLSTGKKSDLAASRSFELNGIDATEKIECLHLSLGEGGWHLELLGKSGEPRPSRPVQLRLKHRDFRDPFGTALRTDGRGRAALGALEGIELLEAQGPEGVTQGWSLAPDPGSLPAAVHAAAGRAVSLPYGGPAGRPPRSEASLIEVRDGTYVADRSAALSAGGGFLRIEDLPPGDYELRLKALERSVDVRVAAGAEAEGHVLGAHRALELGRGALLQIAGVSVDGDALRVRLSNAGDGTRVHVAATRYVPEHPLARSLDVVPPPDLRERSFFEPEALYVVGRELGDEYRYVLERKLAKVFPGNMLARPSLLLSPWAVRGTETEELKALEGRGGGARGAYGERRGKGSLAREGGKAGAGALAGGGFASLELLPEPAVLLANLRPDRDGVVTVQRSALGSGHLVHVLAVGPEEAVSREVVLPERPLVPKDLRLAEGLEPRAHAVEKKDIELVDAGSELVVPDIASAEVEVYDSLARVHALYVTLTGDPSLAEFAFAVRWPQLKPEEKREKYSRFACHELNFFLFKKDPAFFEEVVKPTIANKLQKTFLDRWLLGEDLEAYRKPWAFGRLNVFVRILLSRRLPAEKDAVPRHVKDLVDLLPVDLARLEELFATALRGRALEAADELGLEKARKEAKPVRLAEAMKRPAEEPADEAPRPAAPPPAAAPAKAPVLALDAEQAGEAMEELARDAVAAEGEAKDDDGELRLEDKKADDRASRKALGKAELERRRQVRQLYRSIEKTQEWAENNYYKVPNASQDASLVTPSGFWLDYARHDGRGPFTSARFAEASRSFTEMMLALAVLDLPFQPGEHATSLTGTELRLRPGSQLIAVHKQVREARVAEERTPILVTQSYYRHGERFREEGGEKTDNFIAGELLTHVVYGCNVVVTNPTSSRQALDVLLQVPRGAVPVQGGQYTRSVPVRIEPYHTWSTDYFFYFPKPGELSHFPVHVSKGERLVAFAEPKTLKVVETPSTVDEGSWDYLSQNGTGDQVLAFLGSRNLGNVRLERMAWRLEDRAFFEKAVAVLEERHVYDATVWSYGLRHDVPSVAEQFLRHADAFVAQCGTAIASPLLTIDPVERRAYEHREYWPLVNARAHRLGRARVIPNDRFHQQYLRLMTVLAYRPKLDDEDLLSVACYLVLQDRTEDALRVFGRIRPQGLDSKLQYDYTEAYLAFSAGDVRRARGVAERYAKHPADRWRNLFLAALSQLDEVEGKAGGLVDVDDRDQAQGQLAATAPALDLELSGSTATIRYQNMAECRVSYYLMDIELLFSRNPFVGEHAGAFSYVRPNNLDTVRLDPAKTSHVFEIPERFRAANVLVEVSGAGLRASRTHYSSAMDVRVTEPYAQARVTDAASGKPLPEVYVKVYARRKDGSVQFYKDGYTDLRGRFDYGSLSTDDLDHAARFAALFLSPSHGAVVREAEPPKR